MHCALLGVGEQFTNYFAESMDAEDIIALDEILHRIRSPEQLGRLSRLFSDRGNWKAREWENWILYYSVPALKAVLKPHMKEKLDHWCLFVSSLYILLGSTITINQLNDASAKIADFVKGTQLMYSTACMSYNVHQLLHLVESVRNWGPLWAHSAFSFESANKQSLQAIQCAKGVNQLILRYVNLQRTVRKLENHVYPCLSPKVIQYCENVSKPMTAKVLKLSDITYFGRTSP